MIVDPFDVKQKQCISSFVCKLFSGRYGLIKSSKFDETLPKRGWSVITDSDDVNHQNCDDIYYIYPLDISAVVMLLARGVLS